MHVRLTLCLGYPYTLFACFFISVAIAIAINIIPFLFGLASFPDSTPQPFYSAISWGVESGNEASLGPFFAVCHPYIDVHYLKYFCVTFYKWHCAFYNSIKCTVLTLALTLTLDQP